MNIFTLLTVGLPLAPVQGVIAVGKILQEQVERELGDVSSVRRKLEETESAAESGEVSEDEAEQAKKDALRPLVSQRTVQEAAPDRSDSHAEER